MQKIVRTTIGERSDKTNSRTNRGSRRQDRRFGYIAYVFARARPGIGDEVGTLHKSYRISLTEVSRQLGGGLSSNTTITHEN